MHRFRGGPIVDLPNDHLVSPVFIYNFLLYSISMANTEDHLASIVARLDLIAHLLLLTIDRNRLPAITEQIALLADHGLTPAEIGRVIGRKPNYVSAMSKGKKKGRKDAR